MTIFISLSSVRSQAGLLVDWGEEAACGRGC